MLYISNTRIGRRVDQTPVALSCRWGSSRLLDPAAAHQVEDIASAKQQVIGDDPSVAAPPHRFGAHDRRGPFGGHPVELVETIAERSRQRIVRIIVEALVLPIGVELWWDLL